MPASAPTAAELLKDPVIRAAIEQAWLDSKTDDPALRHEEGGWIYLDLITLALSVKRQASNRRASIDLSNPPVVAGAVVVGVFHTHPNPSAEGWEPGPSPQDELVDAIQGVPDLIRADDGIHASGPDRRRGGLTGGPGYPP